MNEISVHITYFHKKNSWLNIKNLRLKVPPYINHGKFQTMRRTLDLYESFCRKNLIDNIPNLWRAKTLKVKEEVKGMVGDNADDEKDEQN